MFPYLLFCSMRDNTISIYTYLTEIFFYLLQTATGGGPPGSHRCYGGIKEWCIAWWHSGREDSEDYGYEPEEPSDLGYATPVSIETPLQSSVSR